MYCVYIISSLSEPNQKYVGFTSNINNRLADHNAGKCSHTARFMPWKLNNAIFFNNKEKALEFESYLKSGSGRSFITKHF